MSLFLTQVYGENGSMLFLVVLLIISVEIQTVKNKAHLKRTYISWWKKTNKSIKSTKKYIQLEKSISLKRQEAGTVHKQSTTFAAPRFCSSCSCQRQNSGIELDPLSLRQHHHSYVLVQLGIVIPAILTSCYKNKAKEKATQWYSGSWEPAPPKCHACSPSGPCVVAPCSTEGTKSWPMSCFGWSFSALRAARPHCSSCSDTVRQLIRWFLSSTSSLCSCSRSLYFTSSSACALLASSSC